MSDLEITKKCAEAMGYEEYAPKAHWTEDDRKHLNVKIPEMHGLPTSYDPLHDDAQCFALVKKVELQITAPNAVWMQNKYEKWVAYKTTASCFIYANSSDLNRAVCECVAKIQEGK